ncbi:MAG: transketolase [Acidobacteria bacterium]|nr:transketolase [Acidobacteriota bacterium]MBV9624496.1 transketolase [Acidobacteriota bacterium]
MAVSDQTVVTAKQLETLSINTIRTLSIDGVEKAKSGHPGAPMAFAPVAYCLWQQFLRYDPADPVWPNRDRFVLSNGHASMLLYSMLYLSGVKSVDADYRILDRPAVSLDDIKNFRQLDSRTPGHPEYRLTTGIETTTGPLGQGVGNSVGIAIAGKWLEANYNRPGFQIFNYRIYVFCSDGDMMEGVGSEAASLAGHLKLPNLCWIYDANQITLDGPADWSFSEDVGMRFRAYGWNVTHVRDANDLDAVARGLREFHATKDRPTLMIVNSHIGYGAPHKQDTNAAHGEPLGEEETRLAKKFYGWPEDAKFLVPDGVREHFQDGIGRRGRELSSSWRELFRRYTKDFPDLAGQLNQMERRELPEGWDKGLPTFPPDVKGIASRESSGKVLNALANNIPWLIGGSADLATSNKTTLTSEAAGEFRAGNYGGRNFHFGVREHGMASALNGMAVSKLRAFGGTFFNFTDYMRPAMRLAAIMELPTIYVLTHDSIGLGEDGPTHQPVEQLASLRAMPHMIVFRPGDANEVVEAWKTIMPLKHNPVALVLSRQALPTIDRTKYRPASGVGKGGYVLADPADGKPDVILIGTGSELSLCVEAYEKLTAEGIRARVVSMPSSDIFDMQDDAYKNSVLPPEVKARVSVEAASTFGWERYVGLQGAALGMKTFGASAPAKDLMKKFGFTTEKVIQVAKSLLART